MILLPCGHEQTEVRRLPWVTITILSLCLVAFLLSGRAAPLPREDVRIQRDILDAITWYVERPYLRLSPEFEEMFFGGAGGEQMREMFGFMSELRQNNPPLHELLAEQEHLDTLMARAVEGLQNHTLRRWGLVPAHSRSVGWLTHMFLHAGWLHLLGNMLILFLAGPFIEDVWGRPIYAGFYILSGLVAAGFHILSAPDSTLPMIGASGAIAGVMGAFLIRYGKTKIKFFYFMFLFRGTFMAPAWLMIPLWFACQLWMGLLTSELDVQAGVAYWAHIGGFALGVGTAWFMASKRIEQRFVDPNIQSKITLEVDDNKDVVEALELRESDFDLAFRKLSLIVMNRPRNHDAAAALWQMAVERDRTENVAPLMLRSVGHQLRADDPELALDLWADVQRVVGTVRGDPRQLVRLGQAFVERNRFEEALVTLQMALDTGRDRLDPTLALVIARVTREWGPSTARAAARHALDHPAADAETRAGAQKMLAALESAPVELDVDLDPDLEKAPVDGEEPSGEQFGGKSSIPLSS